MEWDLVKVSLSGIMGKSLKEIGKMEWKMVMGSGDPQMVIIMKDNGHKIDSMEMVYLNITQAHIKVNFPIFWNMGVVKKFLWMAINIKVNINKESLMVEVDINGIMEVYMKANLNKGREKVMEFG